MKFNQSELDLYKAALIAEELGQIIEILEKKIQDAVSSEYDYNEFYVEGIDDAIDVIRERIK